MSAEVRVPRWSKLAIALSWLLLGVGSAAGQRITQVRAVLFYSPTCPHCHEVMTVNLPPLMEQYGNQLQIVAISTMTSRGEELYIETVKALGIPDSRLGVPTLVVGDRVLVGSSEIPSIFPVLIRDGLAANGIDWPQITGLRELLQEQGMLGAAPAVPVAAAADSTGAPNADTAAQRAVAGQEAAAPVARAGDSVTTSPPAVGAAGQDAAARAAPPTARAGSPAAVSAEAPAATPAPSSPVPDAAAASPDTISAAPAMAPAAGQARPPIAGIGLLGADGLSEPGMLDRFRTDPVGNSVAVVVLLAMLVALAAVGSAVVTGRSWRPGPEWLIPTAAVLGAGVAAYLAYVEKTGAQAVCGPVGDCNTVQQSQYAWVAGLPVGLLGLLGYALLLTAWALAKEGPPARQVVARRMLWVGALMGTLFSVYLTFLEPFVIGATCAWCIASALLMTGLLLLTTPGGLAVGEVAEGAERT